ncbi:hypothetical protein [Shewanella litoralis]|uniref:Tetratricopeptide repeat protein n=1 Tax=Shewanella litoralis TaxID=2282700 RepID=A0ABQ2R1F2_9GAMM|nr:hypothetical protein [Shewanella litoralis]GGQ03273.1 hypothetical protein GCM10009411_00320 [Shewanella litoralis]
MAKQELEKSNSTSKPADTQSKVVSQADTTAVVSETREAEAATKQDSDVLTEPQTPPAAESTVEPEVVDSVEPEDTVPAKQPAIDAEVSEPKAIVADEVDTEKAPEVKAEQPSKDDVPVTTPQAEADEDQGHQLSLATVKGDWASDSFVQLVTAANKASGAQSQHDALANVINHCYKMRKQSDYCQYGAALKLAYLDLFRVVYQQQVANDNAQDIKAPAFMQLSTLLNDTDEFDQAISVCQQAIEYHLTDGTVTGFEGRINRIEKAQAKAS